MPSSPDLVLPPKAAIRHFQDFWMQGMEVFEFCERLPSGVEHFVGDHGAVVLEDADVYSLRFRG